MCDVTEPKSNAKTSQKYIQNKFLQLTGCNRESKFCSIFNEILLNSNIFYKMVDKCAEYIPKINVTSFGFEPFLPKHVCQNPPFLMIDKHRKYVVIFEDRFFKLGRNI